MILVDSSVWIDLFREKSDPRTDFLIGRLGTRDVAIPDLVLTEVLQGFTRRKDFDKARRLFEAFPLVDTAGASVVVRAAENYRLLKTKGVTIRSTIDTLIATRCLLDGHALLYSDRDFDPFVEHLGLRAALPADTFPLSARSPYDPSSALLGRAETGHGAPTT